MIEKEIDFKDLRPYETFKIIPADYFENLVEFIVEAISMDEAVNAAYKISSSGDCVLLSPACASFDLFDDFEDRGRQFKTAVRKL